MILKRGKREIHIRYQFLLCSQFFFLFYQTSINMCLFGVDKQCSRNMSLEEKVMQISLFYFMGWKIFLLSRRVSKNAKTTEFLHLVEIFFMIFFLPLLASNSFPSVFWGFSPSKSFPFVFCDLWSCTTFIMI